MVKHASEIPEIVKKAYYIASSGRPGPVVIDVPKDITSPAETFPYEYPKTVKIRSYTPATRGNTGQIKKAAPLLLGAKRPASYPRGAVVQGHGSQLLRALARKPNYPVTNTLPGLACYHGTDRQPLSML